MNKSGIILLSGLALAGAKELFAQNSVSGYRDRLDNNELIDSALVQIENFGQAYINGGFYDI